MPVISNMVVVVDVMGLVERRTKMIKKPYHVAIVLSEMATRAAVCMCQSMKMFSGFGEMKRIIRNVTVSFKADQYTIKVSGSFFYLMRGCLNVLRLVTARIGCMYIGKCQDQQGY